ncbi:FecCD family ABC transporter permease [Nakamurella flava]|uniref:FecCD family ABC transporter permease n=1 Tax=Nakamurella flava TaxID=2576308 RepID=UPI001F10A81F|nr:iron chelate uptake ABC transporter family permease subunit [Nakamurella flava]
MTSLPQRSLSTTFPTPRTDAPTPAARSDAPTTAAPGGSTRPQTPPSRDEPRLSWLRRLAGTSGRKTAIAVVLFALVVLVSLLSVAIGSRTIPLSEVLGVLFSPDGSQTSTIVHELRIPRTLLGLIVGVALGLAGAVMQALTRNPLADPGLLGVNAGAAVAVVGGIAVFGIGTAVGYLPFAMAGAAVASLVVYLLGAAGRSGATPVRLALAGVAVTAALTAVIEALTLLDPATFDRYRFWVVGALAGRGMDVFWPVLIPIVVGSLLALLLGRSLNAMALGDDVGRALGARIGRTRIASGLVIMLLAGAATAAAGPISFLGLAVPHAARAITGPDNRWVLAYSALLAPLILVGADVIGRVVLRPGELGVGTVTAILGAPIFIALVRRRRVAQL